MAGVPVTIVEQLKRDAENYINSKSSGDVHCQFMYRDKDRAYWTQCEEKGNQIEPNPKGTFGTDGNPVNGEMKCNIRYLGVESEINRELKGIYFLLSVGWGTGETFEPSIFGDVRVELPLVNYLNDDHNLYFNDYHKSSKFVVRVTLVLCRKGTDEDKECSDRLVKLDLTNNTFLWEDNLESFSMKKTDGLYIALFYATSEPLMDIEEVKNKRSVEYDRSKGPQKWYN